MIIYPICPELAFRCYGHIHSNGREANGTQPICDSWSENLILGMEPKFHADWSKKRRDRGLCSNVLNSIFQCKSSKHHEQPKQQWLRNTSVAHRDIYLSFSRLSGQLKVRFFIITSGNCHLTNSKSPIKWSEYLTTYFYHTRTTLSFSTKNSRYS